MKNYQFNPNYYNTLDQIYHTGWITKKLVRLELVKKIFKQLLPMDLKTKLIQVAGTSGKGSVCKFLEAGLSLTGKAGTFTSPHLYDYRERYFIGGKIAQQEDIIWAWEKIKPILVKIAQKNCESILGYFDINILIALLLFDKFHLDWAVLETGMGGRYDVTSIFNVKATVLTTIAADHEHLLGRSNWQRTLDKAGIIRKNTPLFSTVNNPESRKFIKFICQNKKAPLFEINPTKIQTISNNNNLLDNPVQLINARLAEKVIKYYYPKLPSKKIWQKFSQVKFPGRTEKITDNLYIDIAHNEEKVTSLAQFLAGKFSGKKIIFVVGLSGQRKAREVFRPIIKLAKKIIVTSAGFKGIEPQIVARDIKIIAQKVPVSVISSPKQALYKTLSKINKNDLVVLTGSTYMIEQARNTDLYLRELNATIGWRYVLDTQH